MLLPVQESDAKGIPDGDVTRRCTRRSHDLTAALFLPKCPFARLASREFLRVSGYVNIQAEEPPIREIPTRPNGAFTPAAGGRV